ncbi:MAG: O-antigen ligase family protein [Bacteroidia bacterium]|nr:O-antigen ligase family protein [Bacteroidia bacterium]
MESIQANKLFSYFIILCIACIPLVQLSVLADPTLLSRQVYLTLLQIILIIPIWFFVKKESYKIPKTLVLLSLTWFIISALSLLYAKNLPEAWYSLSKYGLLVSSLFIIYQALSSGWLNLHMLSKGIAGASMISLALWLKEIVEKTTDGKSLWVQKNLYDLQTVFGHKNLYSSFILLCLPFIFYLLVQAKKGYKYAWLGYLLILIASIFFTQTKAVLLGLLVALFTGISVAMFSLKPLNKSRLIATLSVYIIGFVGVIALIYVYPEKFTLLLNNDTIRERLLLWNNTWQMILESFPWGVGLGNWQVYFPKYGLANFMETNYLISDGYTTFQRPHNDFLWVLSETGLIGFVSYLGLITYCFYKGIKGLKNTTDAKGKLILSGFLIIGMAYIMVALVDFPLERNEHQFLWAIICCILVGSDRENRSVFKGKTFLLIPGILLVFSLYFGLNRLKQEAHSKKVIMAHSAQNWGLLLSEAKKINPAFLSIDNFSIPIKWYEGLAYFSLNEWAKAKECFLKAYDVNPYQVHVINNVASIYEKEGNHDEALSYYDKLLDISPKQPDALLNKSAVLYNMNQIDEAMACLYQFVYDEKNDQFLLYLNTIGKSYLHKHPNKLLVGKELSKEYIQNFFKYNQENKHTFEELKPISYE